MKYENVETGIFIWPNDEREVLFYVQEKSPSKIVALVYHLLDGSLRYEEIEKEVFEDAYSIYWKTANIKDKLKRDFIIDLFSREIYPAI